MSDDFWDDLNDAIDEAERELAIALDLSPDLEAVFDRSPAIAEGQVGMFGDDNDFKVAWQHWRGMPAFVQEDLEPWMTCVVKFRNPEDRQAFAELVGQPLRGWRSGAGIWFPKIEVGHYFDKHYRDASADEKENASVGG